MSEIIIAHPIEYCSEMSIRDLRNTLLQTSAYPINHFHPYSRAFGIETKVRFGYNEEMLAVHWEVVETQVRAECDHDGQPVWQDSCVELFVRSFRNPLEYVNIEANSQGVLLCERGTKRQDRTEFSKEEYTSIERYPEFDPESADGKKHWSLLLCIPAKLLGVEGTFSEHPAIMANSHKCSSEPSHWATLFEIHTPRPDFHRPEFFRQINLG